MQDDGQRSRVTENKDVADAEYRTYAFLDHAVWEQIAVSGALLKKNQTPIELLREGDEIWSQELQITYKSLGFSPVVSWEATAHSFPTSNREWMHWRKFSMALPTTEHLTSIWLSIS